MRGADGGEPTRREVTCPHCHRAFEAAPLSGAGGRQQGYKCPHCRLFVPADRTEEPEPAEPTR